MHMLHFIQQQALPEGLDQDHSKHKRAVCRHDRAVWRLDRAICIHERADCRHTRQPADMTGQSADIPPQSADFQMWEERCKSERAIGLQWTAFHFTVPGPAAVMLMLPGNILGDQKDSPCVCYIEPGSKTKLLPMVKSVVCSSGLQAEQLGETAVSGGMCNQIWLVMCSACICFVSFAAVPQQRWRLQSI